MTEIVERSIDLAEEWVGTPGIRVHPRAGVRLHRGFGRKWKFGDHSAKIFALDWSGG